MLDFLVCSFTCTHFLIQLDCIIGAVKEPSYYRMMI